MKTRTERRPEALPVRAQMKTRTEHRSEALPVRAPFPAKPLSSVSRREPRAGNYGIAARPPAGGSAGSRSIPRKAFFFGFRARTPGRKLRKRRTERRLGAHMVRAPSPAKPLTSVSGREPQAGNYGIAARPPAGGSAGSRSIPRKAFFFGFRARTPGRELRNRRSECRLGDQPVRAQMEKYSTKVSRRPPCCTFHYYNPERTTLSCGFMDNRRRTMDKRVDKHSCPHAYPQPCREAGYPQAPQLL